jgi:hypothetical protein
MDSFLAHYIDCRDPLDDPRIAAQLRHRGLVTFSGVTDRSELVGAARRLMVVRPHRDAGPDGVTVITATEGPSAPGFAAFAETGLVPHTDGSSVPEPPGLLLMACQHAAGEGGETLLADAARVIGTLAHRYPDALRALCAAEAAVFGADAGYPSPVCAPATGGRMTIRLRLDDLARFSPECTSILPLLRTVIREHTQIVRLGAGQGLVLSNTRWLHGRSPYAGRRVLLRILGDPLPSAGVKSGFPFPASASIYAPESHAAGAHVA